MLKQADLRGKRAFFTGLLLGLLPASCASLPFPYHFYSPAPVSYEGDLLGPTAKDDISFKTCEPDDKEKSKCVVLTSVEFFRLKQEYLDLEQQLMDCQRHR